ncbi:MAG: hypothetical protein G01um101438_255 [Parcubacteria group bacterium Gr01-1014_38]|nr:MAG: hypothetical protein G01um101438_255 [Parcubacteria group bacterium Gr01-1014_38]
MSGQLHANLRPYLVLAGRENFAQVAERLEEKSRQATPQGYSAAIVVAEDGAPERCEHLLANPCENVLLAIEQKDKTFYHFCYYALRRHDGVVLDTRDTLPAFEMESEQYRVWQDACVALFTGDKALHTALAAALRLHRSLQRHNEENIHDWTERLHARVSISTTLTTALKDLPFAWRAETVVDADTLHTVPREHLELLLAAGLRAGPPAAEHVDYDAAKKILEKYMSRQPSTTGE